MMRYIIISILAAFSLGGFSQEVERQVIGSGGDHFSNATYQISFTIGQFVTETYEAPSVILTQGFQQPGEINFNSIDEVRTSGVYATAFPNPTQGPVTVSLSGLLPREVDLKVLDVTGKQMARFVHGIPNGESTEINVELGRFPAGSYFIQVADLEGRLLNSFVVRKY